MGTVLAQRSGIGQTYEDQDFSSLHAEVLAGRLRLAQFKQRLLNLAWRRQEPWGMKCPATADFINIYEDLFPGARYIWCQRNLEAVLASIKRVRPHLGERERLFIVYRRMGLLDLWLPRDYQKVLELHFDSKRDEADLVKILRRWIEAASGATA